MSNIEKEIIEYIKYRGNATPEEIKKVVRKSYPNKKFYNDDIEKLILKALAQKRQESERER